MARCLSPFTKIYTNKTFHLPCGKCIECLARRVSGWSFRLLKEAELSSSAFFVTLTYDTDHVPITNKGFMTLEKRDIQLWMKRLRKLETNKLKYYLCGEYGGKTKRPHYHVILFNLTDINNIQKTWQKGEIHTGQVEPASVGYTLKYVSKPSKIPIHQHDDRSKEFSLMSKKMGMNYLTPQMIFYHRNDLLNRMYITLKDGKKIAMPRYYKDKIYTQNEKEQIGNYMEINELKEYGNMTYQQMSEFLSNKFAIQRNKQLLAQQKDQRLKLKI